MPVNLKENQDCKVNRRKRINRLKKIIIGSIIFAIAIPVFLCVLLFIKVYQLQNQVDLLLEMKKQIENENDFIDVEESQKEDVMFVANLNENKKTVQNTEQKNDLSEVKDELNERDIESNKRKIYLTFDDGPSEYTDSILDILKEYDVKATFFVNGKEDLRYISQYQRIVDEGHTLGMHSYSHDYKEIYDSLASFSQDFYKLKNFLYDITGVNCNVFRFPGGSSNRVSNLDISELITFLETEEVEFYDWNISSQDASKKILGVETIVENVMISIENYQTAVVLMHDSTLKKSTVDALPIIIERIMELENTEILPISDDTIPIQHIKNNSNINGG